MSDDRSHEEIDDRGYARPPQLLQVRREYGLLRPACSLDAYAGRALNMILKDHLDVGAKRTPILLGKLFQLGL
jgi:hypothetical protein